MRAIATAAAAAATGKWLYYLAVEGESLDYVTNWAQSFDVLHADTRCGPGKIEQVSDRNDCRVRQ